ncbi:hypothetical protein LF1_55660 [Rubripirellula obstinata]|uniref:Uncharacterized protein n=1 Tax=Rubripirellula obstinata TaxID=406547 RepID=A0A5B1C9H1_9BACT|nr:hypothetical protein LF1_55660 [Rubripirellula obstinata]
MECTGAGLARFHKWNINRPRPVMPDVFRLSRGHLPAASRPAAHNQCTTNARPKPLGPNARPILKCRLPCGDQPTPDFQCSSMLKCRMHCVAQPTPVFGCST